MHQLLFHFVIYLKIINFYVIILYINTYYLDELYHIQILNLFNLL